MENTTQQFEVGRTYSCRSICDYDCIFTFEVVGRSGQFVALKAADGRIRRRKVSIWDGAEVVSPHGHYSMAPVLSASVPKSRA